MIAGNDDPDDCCPQCERCIRSDYSDEWRHCDKCSHVVCVNTCSCDNAVKLGFCEHCCRCECEILPEEISYAC